MYLARLQILDGAVQSLIPQLKLTVIQVLGSVLELCGICAKYIQRGRVGRWIPSVFCNST